MTFITSVNLIYFASLLIYLFNICAPLFIWVNPKANYHAEKKWTNCIVDIILSSKKVKWHYYKKCISMHSQGSRNLHQALLNGVPIFIGLNWKTQNEQLVFTSWNFTGKLWSWWYLSLSLKPMYRYSNHVPFKSDYLVFLSENSVFVVLDKKVMGIILVIMECTWWFLDRLVFYKIKDLLQYKGLVVKVPC